MVGRDEYTGVGALFCLQIRTIHCDKGEGAAHAAGKHRKGSTDVHVPLTSQAQGYTEIRTLSVHEGEMEKSRSAG